MFSFKKFTVQQDQCAMKVGTDGVLLGAWAPVHHNPKHILDIGTGTGLIALMLAQRCAESQIHAFDIDAHAYKQASQNFLASQWKNRLSCYHADLEEYIAENNQKYELIVVNPPFHTETVLPVESSRKNARSASAMPLFNLAEAVALLLSKGGIFATILPNKLEKIMVSLMAERQLFPIHITYVKGSANTPVKRCLMAFTDVTTQTITDHLIIEETRHQYTPEFTKLVREFYLYL